MKKCCWLWLLLWGFSSGAQAQPDSLSLETIQQKLESFEYPEVISLSGWLLAGRADMSSADSLEIHRMRAIAYYSLGDRQACGNEFLAILHIQPDFQWDPVKTSPKIIHFFEETRTEFLAGQKVPAAPDSAKIASALQNLTPASGSLPPRGVIMRSLLLPGWGHLASGHSAKGWLITALGVGALGSAIYFIGDTRSKEDAYLNETDPALIEARYQAYNSAYRKRNLLIAAYAAVWLYAQVDLLYFSKKGNSARSNAQNALRVRFLPEFHLSGKTSPAIQMRMALAW